MFVSHDPSAVERLCDRAVMLDHGRVLGRRVFSEPRSGLGAVDPGLEAKLGMGISELSLSVRASNCLDSENIRTVRDLVIRTEDQLLEVRNFGETTLNEVREKLADLGLRLGMRLPPASPSPI